MFFGLHFLMRQGDPFGFGVLSSGGSFLRRVFYLVHIPPLRLPLCDFLLHGHTHVPQDETVEDYLRIDKSHLPE